MDLFIILNAHLHFTMRQKMPVENTPIERNFLQFAKKKIVLQRKPRNNVRVKSFRQGRGGEDLFFNCEFYSGRKIKKLKH